MAVKNIYVDIDSLFDTRLAMLTAIAPNIASQLSKGGKYANRNVDSYMCLSNDIFEPIYRQRGKPILAYATPTHVINLIREHVSDLILIPGENITKTKLYLNTYPYTLTGSEYDNIIGGLSISVPNLDITIVNFSNIELTPTWVLDNIDMLFKYDGLRWLEMHMANLNLINKPLLDKTLVIPAIIPGKISKGKVNKTLFDNLSSATNTVIRTMIVDTRYFSSIVNNKQFNTKEKK